VKFRCSECGFQSVQWFGRCPRCQSWNTLSPVNESAPQGERSARAVVLSAAREDSGHRLRTGIGELDRVLGGGLVCAQVVLVAGEPGIGKSTLLLQISDRLGQPERPVLYVTAEESLEQIRLRARRLGVGGDGVVVVAESDLDAALEHAQDGELSCLVVDSIQAVRRAGVASLPGSVQQVRECAARVIELAKGAGFPALMAGHVTKEGGVAGPRALEHLVDTVLYFEGDRSYTYRILRATKNRFGSTEEIGLFEMRECGLVEVPNPSEMLLSQRRQAVPGTAVFAGVQGSRPLLVEVQALTTRVQYGTPRRLAAGLDSNRLAIILAVLERRQGLPLFEHDVFMSVAGGVRVAEPAADLAIAAAIVSALRGEAIDRETAFAGEVGLTGELRAVSHLRQRAAEAARLGFRRLIAPSHGLDSFGVDRLPGVRVEGAADLGEALAQCFARS